MPIEFFFCIFLKQILVTHRLLSMEPRAISMVARSYIWLWATGECLISASEFVLRKRLETLHAIMTLPMYMCVRPTQKYGQMHCISTNVVHFNERAEVTFTTRLSWQKEEQPMALAQVWDCGTSVVPLWCASWTPCMLHITFVTSFTLAAYWPWIFTARNGE